MYKLNLELGYVNSTLHMKFTVVYKNSLGKPAFSKFNIGGDDYLRIAPYPNIVLEIREDTERKQMWSTNKTVTLNPMSRHKFVSAGKKMLSDFISEQDLFYYDGNLLKVNQTISKKVTRVIQIPFKAIMLRPIVVEDPETRRLFEGVCMMINSVENYCTMTFDEFDFLVNYLADFNYEVTSIQLIQMAYLTQDIEATKLSNQFQESLADQMLEKKEVVNESGRLPPKEVTTLPEI